MNVGRSLRGARRHARLTQAGLAARARTSQATISAYESGRKIPSIPTLERLLRATGSRLAVEEDLTVNARALSEVLALAAALPVRHERELRYPRLPVTA